MTIGFHFTNLFCLLAACSALVFSTSSRAEISKIKIYDYSGTEKVKNYQILPKEITNYYQENPYINPLAISMQSLVSIATWQDIHGTNYLVQFKRPKHADDKNDQLNELISHLYVKEAQNVIRIWQVYDSIKPCGLDLIADYAEQSPIISDVNDNGVAEVAITHYFGCRGDVGYDDMTVIMYEGGQKYAARGDSALCDTRTNLPVDATGHYGGRHKIDKALLNRYGQSTLEKVLINDQLQSVWRQTQCSITFNYSDI